MKKALSESISHDKECKGEGDLLVKEANEKRIICLMQRCRLNQLAPHHVKRQEDQRTMKPMTMMKMNSLKSLYLLIPNQVGIMLGIGLRQITFSRCQEAVMSTENGYPARALNALILVQKRESLFLRYFTLPFIAVISHLRFLLGTVRKWEILLYTFPEHIMTRCRCFQLVNMQHLGNLGPPLNHGLSFAAKLHM